jgi:hypothetical protein
LRNYLFTFLRTSVVFIAGLSIYLFTLLLSLKFRGESWILIEALKNYGLFLLYSLPFIIIIASCFYFAFIGNDKMFVFRMVPIVSAANTIILLLFFLIKIDFFPLFPPTQLYFYPEVKEGYINTIGDYKIFVEDNVKNNYRKGILFYHNAYLINAMNVGKNTVSVNAYQRIGNGQFYGDSSGFSIPRKEPVMQLKETGITRLVCQNYISNIKYLRKIFQTTFVNGGMPHSIVAILLMSIGFFGLTAGIAGFLSERQLVILSFSALFTLAIFLFFIFPHFLSLVNLIKFGIKNGFFKVTFPGLFVGVFGALIGYGLIELRDLMLKRGGNRQ